MLFNGTTAQGSTRDPAGTGPQALYALVPAALLVLIAGVAAMVFYVRRRSRLEELRHRLIPLYSYDPAEQEDWEDWERGGGEDGEDGEEEEEPLYQDGRLALI